MKDLGNTILHRRKMQGLSQEELAEHSNLSLRTIQRIESGQSEPHGDTLRRICIALKIDIEDLYEFTKTENSQYLVLMYLSSLIYIVLPLGNVILPLILWVFNKNKIWGVNRHGVTILNFQLTWSIIAYFPHALFISNRFLHMDINLPFSFGVWQLIIFNLVIMGAFNIMFIISGAVLAHRGKMIRNVSIPFIRIK